MQYLEDLSEVKIFLLLLKLVLEWDGEAYFECKGNVFDGEQ